MGADDSAIAVTELVPDDHHVMDMLLHVDDAMAGAECLRRAPNLIEGRGHLVIIVRVFVGEDDLGGRRDFAGFVPVHLGYLRGPLPPFVGKVEAKPADMLWRSTGQRLR
ncbi:Uncharacterised protein [Mycobacteroides abscessus subsp. abscessus]|nr:Uncharacterised protein [Mycobacteroides abscessus subsp. abscessus]